MNVKRQRATDKGKQASLVKWCRLNVLPGSPSLFHDGCKSEKGNKKKEPDVQHAKTTVFPPFIYLSLLRRYFCFLDFFLVCWVWEEVFAL